MSWKNYFAIGVARLFQLLRRRGERDHFLIVSTTGLGDTLWATPAIRALRETNPQAYIGCLTSALGAEVLKNNPHLSELFVLTQPLSLIKLYFQLRKKRIGTALLFHTSQRAVLPLCAMIGTSQRLGTAGLQKGLDTLLTQAIPWNARHEIERRLEIVKAVGATTPTYELDFIIDETHRQTAKKLIPEGCVIGLHPGAKDKFKQWPAAYFVKVAKKLQEELHCKIIVTGSPHEKVLVETICAEIEGAQAVIEPLKVMAAVLENLTLFITNDTGPLHLALAMKTKTIALFAPTDPLICGPYHNSAVQVIQASPTCAPCLKKKCRDPFCMRQISPDRVIQTALQVCLCK